jgi:hypothetical protein
MRTQQAEFIDTIIDPIPIVGPLIADLFYTWSGVVDAMNLRHLGPPTPPLPPGDNVVLLAAKPDAAAAIRRAA